VLSGYDTGVISGALLYIPDDFKLTPFLQGAIVGSLLIGAMFGAAFAGRLTDRLGRRRLCRRPGQELIQRRDHHRHTGWVLLHLDSERP